MSAMAVALNQFGWRIRTDATAAQGGTPVWAAAQNTVPDVSAMPAIGTPFRIRFVLANTGSTTSTTHPKQIYASRNAGAYAAVTSATTYVQSADATFGGSADNSNITSSLLTGTGSAQNAGEYDDTGATATFTVTAGDYVEISTASNSPPALSAATPTLLESS